MCGIFGTITKANSNRISPDEIRSLTKLFLKTSESRGKEASGVVLRTNSQIIVYKKPVSATELIANKNYQELLGGTQTPIAVLGHARLVTNGRLEDNKNNQPVIRDGMVVVHNGIIVNEKNLWAKFSNLKRYAEVDTELIPALLKLYDDSNLEIPVAINKLLSEIRGTLTAAIVYSDRNLIVLTTNNGSLYYTDDKDCLLFASEKQILQAICTKIDTVKSLKPTITQLKSGQTLLIDTNSLKIALSEIGKNIIYPIKKLEHSISILDNSPIQKIQNLKQTVLHDYKKYIEIKYPLHRCNRCILPETMPFITFDIDGECNYCNNFYIKPILGEGVLKEKIAKEEKRSCVIPLSGGRDSSYALHYAVKMLGLKPIAFSYDWGMITDLGRRNQARMCGTLGVEHILISADINKKRENIRKNVQAWLKNPRLGTIPIFMAGDKQYFYFLQQLKKRFDNPIILYAENPLEKTDFKSGFASIEPNFKASNLYDYGIKNKLLLANFYFKEFILNPSFINSSLIDSISAYISSFFIKHKYEYLFSYIGWDEKTINDTLINEYDWELAPDTQSTWRIGDGTAAFYNYIYYTVAGFTENDTFRSNQIREGQITREEALKLVERDNQPRWESIRWYCDTIGIDMESAIKRINEIPKLYRQ
jgi:glutamine---fructose-6-phosphate transaminase (isomerizing)